MSIEKMREEFEREMIEECTGSGQQLPDLSLSPCVLDDGAVIYRNNLTQACWWSYRKGWQASRESLVIELPPEWAPVSERDDGANEMREHCISAIESAGPKVKS